MEPLEQLVQLVGQSFLVKHPELGQLEQQILVKRPEQGQVGARNFWVMHPWLVLGTQMVTHSSQEQMGMELERFLVKPLESVL